MGKVKAWVRATDQTMPQQNQVVQEFSSGFPASVAVLIPALNPGVALVCLAQQLLEMRCVALLIVDDGSEAWTQPIFRQLEDMSGITILRHQKNLGKGHALRTGMRFFLEDFGFCDGLVTADADGQHAAEDIARVAAALSHSQQQPVLGVRQFFAAMPLRSRIGNILTRYAFLAATGVLLADTQTGLRGIPRARLAELLEISGSRYEYEMAVLSYWCCNRQRPVEVPIRTIYQNNNETSHFRPLHDSWRIYTVLARHRACR